MLDTSSQSESPLEQAGYGETQPIGATAPATSTTLPPATAVSQPLDILGDDTPATPPNQPAGRPWYKRPGPLIGLALVVLLLLLIATPFLLRALRGGPRRFTSAAVQTGTLALTVGASGNVIAPEYDVSFTHQGTIGSISVAVGQTVSSGATLATLNYTDARGNSQTETITAPHSGTVVAVNGVVDGRPAATFIVIDDLTGEYLSLGVNEADIASVATGQSVTFTVSAYPNAQPFKGTVSVVSADGQNSNNVITYPVTVSIDANSLNGAKLLPQMSVNASIITAQRTNVVLVPVSAVSFAHTEASNGVVRSSNANNALSQAQTLLNQVKQSDKTASSDNLIASYVLEGSGRSLTIVPVVLGLSDGTNYEVLAGLNAGDSVLTAQTSGAGASTAG